MCLYNIFTLTVKNIVSQFQPNRATFQLLNTKRNAEKPTIEQANEGGCSKGLAEHCKGGSTTYGDAHGFSHWLQGIFTQIFLFFEKSYFVLLSCPGGSPQWAVPHVWCGRFLCWAPFPTQLQRQFVSQVLKTIIIFPFESLKTFLCLIIVLIPK